MEYSSTKRKEQEKRKKRLFKTIFVIICFLIISLIIMNRRINNIGIEKIGRQLSNYYSKTNFEYLIETEDSENEEYFLIKRLDDNIDSFSNRFDIYYKNTVPLIKFYEEKGILHKIDSAIGKDGVFEVIQKILGDYND